MAKKNSFGNFDPKELRSFIDEIERGKKETSAWREILDGFSSTFFGFSSSVFFKEVPKSAHQMAVELKAAQISMTDLKKAGLDLQMAFKNTAISDAFGNTKSAVDALRDGIRGNMRDGSAMMDSILKSMDDAAKKGGKVWDSLSLEQQAILAKKLTDEGMEFLDSVTDIGEKAERVKSILFDQEDKMLNINKDLLEQLASHKAIGNALKREVDLLEEAQDHYKSAIAASRDRTTGPSFVQSMKNGLNEVGRLLNQKVMTTLNDVDKGIHEIQRNTGVMMAQNTEGLSRWASGLAEFGLGIQDASNLMEGLGNELRTTDKTRLMGAVDSFKSLSLALGISSDEFTKIGGEMMRMGHSAEDVNDFFAGANKSAKMLGVNSKTVIKQISNNIDKMRQFGFEGGIKSLTKMAAKAESLRIQVDEIFDVASRARTIEGAMDMAAQLQLAGGSFSNINPMELLSAARKGPEELGKILTSMGKEVGHWSDDMKTYEFNPIDVDRLQIVAEATGMSLDSLQKIIQKNAETSRKTDMFPDSMFSGIEDMDKDLAKSTLGDYLEMSKDGKEIVLSTDGAKANLLEKAGIKSYSDINDRTLKAFYDLKKQEGGRLEEQAKQNRGLSDTFGAFSSSLANLFVVFQPLLQKFTEIIVEVSDALQKASAKLHEWFPKIGDYIIPGFIAGLALFKGGVGKILKGAFSSVASMAGKLLGIGKKGGDADGVGGLAGTMRQVSDQSGGIKMGNIMKFTAALGIVGVSVLGFMAGLNAVGGAPGLEQLGAAAGSLAILAGGVWLTSKAAKGIDEGGLTKMAVGMAIVGPAIIGFMAGLNAIGGAPGLEQLGAAAGSLAILAGGILLTSKASKGIDRGGLTKMAVGMAIVGPAVLGFMAGLNAIGGAPGLEQLGAAAGSLAVLAGGILLTSKASKGIDQGGLVKMALGMAIVGPAVIGFMAGLNAIGGAPGLEQLGAAAGSLAILAGGMLGLSMISKAIDVGSVTKMSIAMAIMGASMVPFAFAMNMLDKISWQSMLGSLTMMGVAVAGLFALGALLTGPQMLLLGVGIAALVSVGAAMGIAGAGLLVAGSAFEKLANINWNGFSQMGSALMSAAPGMFAFGAAALMFANPISIIGLGIMTIQLYALSKVMAPLSESLSVSSQSMMDFVSSMNRMKSGVIGAGLDDVFDGVSESLGKMNDALDDSDMSKLSKALSSVKPMGINVVVDVSSISQQLRSLPPIKLNVDRTEVDKMISLLSSINLTLDVSGLEAAVSGMKIGVDTSRLESSLASIQSIDMGSIGSSLSSIEASIRKISEEKTVGVKVTSEDLGASTNKLQTEMMMRLVEAIDRLNSTSSKEQGDRRIVVELEMDGRQLKTKILKDTSILT